jgi:pimeloyl-ACP methyl ester carboxylesterase
MRVGRWLLLAMCLGLNACTSIAAHYIETPGHHGPQPAFRQWLAENTGYTSHDFVTAQNLRIAYWYSPPTRLDIAPRIKERRDGKKFSLSFHFDVSKLKQAAATPPLRGSVVLLHPWGQNALQMAFWGVYFSNAGYVTVLPALRSQGESGDAPVGYGPREAADIVQLIRDLQQRNELPPPLYLFGVSYGATVALFAAPQLPELRGVVALEPYVHPTGVIERAPAAGWFAPKWWAHFFPPHTMRKAIARADANLGIDLASIDPGDAVAASKACTLLVRGSDDILISGSAVRDLAARSPRARYVEIPNEGHVTLFFRGDRLFPPILDWIQRAPGTADGSCPAWQPSTGTPQRTSG